MIVALVFVLFLVIAFEAGKATYDFYQKEYVDMSIDILLLSVFVSNLLGVVL